MIDIRALLRAASQRGPRGLARHRANQRARRARMGIDAVREENRRHQRAKRAR